MAIMKTRAVLLKAPGQLELTERELTVGANEVLVKTEYASICGTDKNIFVGQVAEDHYTMAMHGKGNPLYSNREVPAMPFWIGHEGGGTVEAVGSKVHEYQPGDKVISFSWAGTYADYFVAPVNGLQKVPEGMDMRLACLGEPIGCAMYSVMTSGVNLGDTAVVMGSGFAGLIMVQGLKKRGAYKVIAIDKSDDKLMMAKEMGADVVYNVDKDNVINGVIEETNGKGADLVMEAAGTEQSVNTSSAVLKHNGKLVLYSYITQPIKLNIGRWHDDSFDIRTTCLVHHTENERQVWAPWALRPVAKGQVNVEPLITHTFGLNDIEKAFETVCNNPDAVKVMLKP